MKPESIKENIPRELFQILDNKIEEFRPCQKKAISAGLLNRKNILICTPTASGKTLAAEIAAMISVFQHKKKAVYVVPLKALANEKVKEFRKDYGQHCKIALSIRDADSSETRLAGYDLIVTTAEKMDSVIRHHAPWLNEIGVLIVDEIHLLNDPSRGPTLEILITIIRKLLPNIQIIGLSATIGNPKELAGWLNAELVIDDWRPTELKKGVLFGEEIKFPNQDQDL